MVQSVSVHMANEPDPWIAGWIERLPTGARVLDFAAGRGRHALLARRRGHESVAVDRDEAALATIGDGVRTIQCDLENADWPFAPESFDALIVANYLYRPRLDRLCGLIRPTGVLLYQTFADGNAGFGRPGNPDFLLAPGELLALAARCGLQVIEYGDGVAGVPARARIQRMAAQKPPLTPLRWSLCA